MDADEKVRIEAVCNPRSLIQLDKDIRLPRHDDGEAVLPEQSGIRTYSSDC
jgi:hypothetical protein